jgi:hypothetical protein
LRLILSGEVKNFAQVEPRRVSLVGVVGEKSEKLVTITPVTDYPFKILETKAVKGEFIDTRLEEKKADGALLYELTVTNLKAEAGYYSDTIVIITDSDIRPELKIHVRGNLRASTEEALSNDQPGSE